MGKKLSKMEKENETPMESAEELEAEKGHLAEVKEDEIRSTVISEFGFDEENDKEKIDKLVERELGHRKTLSTTIGQKIKYREALGNNKPKDPQKTDTENTKVTQGDLDSRVSEGVQKALKERDLNELEYPDDIKAIIKKVADTEDISIKKAVEDPYVASKIQAWNDENNRDEASITRNNNGGKPSGSSTNTDLTPPDVDLNTEEGRKEYDDWKKNMISQGH